MAMSGFESTISELVARVATKLDEPGSIAKAAQTCTEAANAQHAVQILMSFEGPAHEALDLFKATLAIRWHLLTEPG